MRAEAWPARPSLGRAGFSLLGELSQLSARRVAAVAAYLAAKGIDAGAISSDPVGESKLRVPTTDNQVEAQNRRVEIQLVAVEG